jgi:hypothetical protein
MQIPIQGVYEHYGDTYTLIRTPEGEFDTREITLGPTNDTVAVIEEGLEEGEDVVLNLRSYLDYMDLPEPDPEERQRMTDEMSESQLASSEDGPSDQGRKPKDDGMPSASDIVDRSFEQYDSDGDGVISASEMESMDERARGMARGADGDGDGNVTRSEMLSAAAKLVARIRKMRNGQGQGGGPSFGG